MSRTYKDKPWKLHPDYWRNDNDRLKIEGSWKYLQLPTTKPKRRKEVDYKWHWMTTPGWWIRCFMTKPQRRAGSLWEREVVKTQVTELEEVDKPSVSRKPHLYYW